MPFLYEGAETPEITKIGVIGTGVMGSMMTLLLAERADIDVSIYDRSEESMQRTKQKAYAAGLDHKVHACKNIETLCQSLGSPRVFLFSLPHGGPGDGVVKTLTPYLSKGDIVIDGSNENYAVTQKRQGWLQSRGVSYIGMGVSGGFNGARHGPSLMPGGDEKALDQLLPFLKKIAAKDDQGRSCVAKIGSGGSGHYVKMIHNGIEHGVMSVLCEAWGLMDNCLRMAGDEIGAVFDAWNREGELRDNFLIAISGPICRTKRKNGTGYLLHDIRDTVVQDANDSEGTGVWANLESITSHVPTPSLLAAHSLRLASANNTLRSSISTTLNLAATTTPPPAPTDLLLTPTQRSQFLTDLHQAVYASVLSCFIQGLDVLSRKSQHEGWNINLEEVVRIWRAGCIIKSDYITDLLERHYANFSTVGGSDQQHPLLNEEICHEVQRCWPSLKKIVLRGIEADACLPALSSTLDYLKYSGSTNLPTCFMEAQLDAFGAHGYDLKSEKSGVLAKGKHHSDWSQVN